MNKKKLVLFLFISFLLILVFIFVSFFFLVNKKPQAKPPVLPVPSDFEKDYSKIIYLVPGKSTYNDVLKTLGSPVSETIDKNKTVLNYPTPNLDYKNTVVLKNGVVEYAIEYVFSTYRGTYKDFINTYGGASLRLFPKANYEIPWYIFLKNGLGIESNEIEVSKIIYFIPQSSDRFLKNIAPELNLSTEEYAGQEDVLVPTEPTPEP